MHNKLCIIISLAILLVFSVSSAHALTCSVTNGACSGTNDRIIFKMSGSNNAHAELRSESSYNYKVCCGGPFIGWGCSVGSGGNLIARFSHQTNAHAEMSNDINDNSGNFVSETSFYDSNYACISSSSPEGGLLCSYYSGGCPSGYECLAALYSDTNSHVAECANADYDIKICCFQDDNVDPVYQGATLDESDCRHVEKTDMDNKECWVDRYQTVNINIQHSDHGTPPGTQYLKFVRGGTEVESSYDIDDTDFDDIRQDNSLVNIQSASCISGCTGADPDVDVRWTFESRSTTANIEIQATAEDEMGNKETTYADTKWWLMVDARDPTIGDDYTHDDSWVTTGQTFTITASDWDSGIEEAFYCISNNGNDCNPETGANAAAMGIICSFSTRQGNNQCEKELTFSTSMNARINYIVRDFVGQEDSGSVDVMINLPNQVTIISDPPIAMHEWVNQPTTATAVCTGDCANVWAAARPFGSSHVCQNDFTYTTNPVTVNSHSWVCGKSENSAGIASYTAPIEFFVDTRRPESVVDDITADYGNWISPDECFEVTWTVTDWGGSGPNFVKIEYRAGSGAWQEWNSFSGGTTSANFCDFVDGEIYAFRSIATNLGGNEETDVPAGGDTSIIIDIGAPSCVINPLPAYTNISEYYGGSSDGIPLTWVVDDGTGSGVASVDIMYESFCDHESCDTYCNNPGTTISGATSPTKLRVDAFRNCTFRFQCDVTDRVGNNFVTDVFDAETTTLDLDYPEEMEFIEPYLPETNGWSNDITNFYVSWTGKDWVSGLDTYTIQWKYEAENWATQAHLLNVTDQKTNLFNVLINHGDHFYFRFAATDVAGNDGPGNDQWVYAGPDGQPVEIRFDTNDPNVEVEVTNQDDKDLTGVMYVMADGNESINLNVTAYDDTAPPESGVDRILVKYDYFNGQERVFETKVCDSGNECLVNNLGYAEDTAIKFSGEVYDVAGNMAKTEVFRIVAHPIANFLVGQQTIVVGQPEYIDLDVRNLNDVTDKITLSFNGYEYAGFVVPSDPAFVIPATETGDYIRALEVTLNPNEQRTIKIYLGTTSPSEYVLQLDATAEKAGISDYDDIVITVRFPPSFPGMDTIAVIVLMLLSLPLYMITKRMEVG